MADPQQKISSVKDLLEHIANPGEKDLEFSHPKPVPPTPALQAPGISVKPIADNTPRLAKSIALGGAFHSSIRTMASDISRLASGERPAGLEIDRTISSEKVSPLVGAGQVDSKGQKGSLIPGGASNIKPTYTPVAPSPKKVFGMSIPGLGTPRSQSSSNVSGMSSGGVADSGQKSGIKINKKFVMMGLGGLVLIAGAYMAMRVISSKEPDVAITTFTPRPSRAPAKDINSLFKSLPKFDLKIGEKDNIIKLYTAIDVQTLNQKQFKVINIISENASGSLSFTNILDRFSIKYPDSLKTEIGSDYRFMVYRQSEIFQQPSQSDKRLVIVVSVKDPTKANQMMSQWSQTLISDFATLLQFPSANASFSENKYNGVTIRFSNFSLPDKSLDYAVIENFGKNYVVITNSRESMYAIIDKIKSN